MSPSQEHICIFVGRISIATLASVAMTVTAWPGHCQPSWYKSIEAITYHYCRVNVKCCWNLYFCHYCELVTGSFFNHRDKGQFKKYHPVIVGRTSNAAPTSIVSITVTESPFGMLTIGLWAHPIKISPVSRTRATLSETRCFKIWNAIKYSRGQMFTLQMTVIIQFVIDTRVNYIRHIVLRAITIAIQLIHQEALTLCLCFGLPIDAWQPSWLRFDITQCNTGLNMPLVWTTLENILLFRWPKNWPLKNL